MTGDEVTGDTLREAMVAYRTRWEMVAEVEAEELRQMSMEQRLQQYIHLVAMARSMSTFDSTVAYNEANVQPVRARWQSLKEGIK